VSLLQVSVDFRCTDVSTTIDASLTMVMGDDMVKVVSWYDNEWGYRSVLQPVCLAASVLKYGWGILFTCPAYCSISPAKC